MKLVIIIPSFPKLSENFIVNKFRGLLNQGWDLHVICTESDPAEWASFPELENWKDIRQRVHKVWPRRPRWLAALLTPVALLRCGLFNPGGCWRYLSLGWRRFGPDVLRRLYLDAELIVLQPHLIHFEFGALAVDRMYLKALLGCKVTISFRGYDLNFVGLETPNYYREIWEQADALHFLGQDLWHRAKHRGCLPNKSHMLIPPAVDPLYLNPSIQHHYKIVGTPQRPLRIVSVGRLEWIKGYEFALQAVKALVDQGLPCEYRIVGGGSHLEAIAFARHQLGLKDVVELLDYRSPEEVKASLIWADVFLHAAVSEGFCNAVMEAQAMQLPVVCTDAGGLPENVIDDETGFVVPRRNPQALAEKLNLLAHAPSLRERMGQAGRERVQTHFRLEDQIAAFERFYQDFC
jgi:colanic acid/amylovoran biosynthesis glycosyltransferase